MKITVEFPVPWEPNEFAHIINSLAKWLESDTMPPDHWDTAKRTDFYQKVAKEFTLDACIMIRKFLREM